MLIMHRQIILSKWSIVCFINVMFTSLIVAIRYMQIIITTPFTLKIDHLMIGFVVLRIIGKF